MKQNWTVKLFHELFEWFGGDSSHHLRLSFVKAQEVWSSCSALSNHHGCERVIVDSLSRGLTAALCSALGLLFDSLCAPCPFIEAYIAMFKTKFKTLECSNIFKKYCSISSYVFPHECAFIKLYFLERVDTYDIWKHLKIKPHRGSFFQRQSTIRSFVFLNRFVAVTLVPGRSPSTLL